jgi:hypothetical protein
VLSIKKLEPNPREHKTSKTPPKPTLSAWMKAPVCPGGELAEDHKDKKQQEQEYADKGDAEGDRSPSPRRAAPTGATSLSSSTQENKDLHDPKAQLAKFDRDGYGMARQLATMQTTPAQRRLTVRKLGKRIIMTLGPFCQRTGRGTSSNRARSKALLQGSSDTRHLGMVYFREVTDVRGQAHLRCQHRHRIYAA